MPDSPRAQRQLHLQDYIFHVIELARSGGEASEVAYDVMHRKFLPLMNAGWRARGGDQFQWATGHGNTIVDDETMRHFVSEQVYAVDDRGRYDDAPQGRLGFSWQPCNRAAATEPGCGPMTPAFNASLDRITARIAEAVHYSFRQDGAGPFGACRPPGPNVDWCEGVRADAAFTDNWSHFRWED